MFHIIEIQSYQKQDEVTKQWYIYRSDIVVPIPQYSDLNEAKAAYYQKLAYAYQSSIDIHTVSLVDHNMKVIESETVLHVKVEGDVE